MTKRYKPNPKRKFLFEFTSQVTEFFGNEIPESWEEAHHDQPHADTVTLRVAVCELWKTDLAKELLLKYGGSDYLEEVERMRIKVSDFLQKEL